MDRPVREGLLYIQNQKFGKKWKKNWVVLYPASQFGVARLEFFDTKESSAQMDRPNTKRLDRKIVRLAECISILPLPTETCPKNNMAAFYVETNDRSYVFATDKQESSEWITKLCEIAFPNIPNDLNKAKMPESEGGETDVNVMQMAVNSIYFSREEVNEFWVTVQKTEAAERCGLHGSYTLKAGKEGLVLKDTRTKQSLFTWPYKLLRRYGRDKVMFSFEAGRRCDSGPGNFTFETKQGNEIFLIVESSIKEQKAQADENRQSYSSLDADCPMLMQIRNTIAESVTENNATTTDEELPGDTANTDITSGDTIRTWPINKVGSNEALFVKKEVKLKSLEEREAVKMLKGRVLPEPPVPTAKPTVLNTPPRSPLHKVPKSLLENLEDPTIVYSEPKDSMRFHKPSFDNLYSDPVDSVASGAGKVATLVRPNAMPEEGMLGPLYADLYEQVDLAMLNPPPDVKGKVPKANHIYDEPEGRARPPAPIPTSSLATLKIYDEAILSQDAWKTQAIDEKLGYEYPYNPSTDDYSVPLSQPLNQKPKAKPKGPKPVPAPKPQVTKFGDQGMSGRAPWGTHNVNNSNSSSLVSDAVYSRVIKPGRGQGAAVSPSSDQREGGQEHSVDEQRSTSIYEDLGEL